MAPIKFELPDNSTAVDSRSEPAKPRRDRQQMLATLDRLSKVVGKPEASDQARWTVFDLLQALARK